MDTINSDIFDDQQDPEKPAKISQMKNRKLTGLQQSLTGKTLKKRSSSMLGSFSKKDKEKVKEDPDLLQKSFIDQYGVEMEFPGQYYHKAQFVPHEDNLVLLLGYHSMPHGHNLVI